MVVLLTTEVILTWPFDLPGWGAAIFFILCGIASVGTWVVITGGFDKPAPPTAPRKKVVGNTNLIQPPPGNGPRGITKFQK